MERRSKLERLFPALLFTASGCATTPPSSPPNTPPPIAQAEPSIEAFTLPQPDLTDSRPLTLWATHYSVPRVQAIDDGHPLLDPDGKALGPKLATRGFCDAGMEGTVQVLFEGRWRTYNYAGTGSNVQVDCSARYPRHPATGRSRFRASTKPFGEGSTGARLIPFRSIAVDPRFIPYGSLLYIPAARGVEISGADGEKFRRDGYFFAADTGGAIRGSHIDVFFGPSRDNPFTFIGSARSSKFEAFLIEDAELAAAMSVVHELQPQS